MRINCFFSPHRATVGTHSQARTQTHRLNYIFPHRLKFIRSPKYNKRFKFAGSFCHKFTAAGRKYLLREAMEDGYFLWFIVSEFLNEFRLIKSLKQHFFVLCKDYYYFFLFIRSFLSFYGCFSTQFAPIGLVVRALPKARLGSADLFQH